MNILVKGSRRGRGGDGGEIERRNRCIAARGEELACCGGVSADSDLLRQARRPDSQGVRDVLPLQSCRAGAVGDASRCSCNDGSVRMTEDFTILYIMLLLN